jgi:hypothetical protein
VRPLRAELVDQLWERRAEDRARRQALPVSAGEVLAWARELRAALAGGASPAGAEAVAGRMERRARAVMADARDLAEELWAAVPPWKVQELCAEIRGQRVGWADAVWLLASEAEDGERVPAEARAHLVEFARQALRARLRAERRGGGADAG